MNGDGTVTSPSKQEDPNDISTTTRLGTYTVCSACHGQGSVTRPPSKKQKLRWKRARTTAISNPSDNPEPINDDSTSIGNHNGTKESVSIPGRIEPCKSCQGSGLQSISKDALSSPPLVSLPRIAIVGGGLAGLALAAACRHRQIPHMVFERDASFHQRSQGYGLTMQQATKALQGLGLSYASLVENAEGITSTRHVVHTPDGTVVGEWGYRKWGPSVASSNNNDSHHTPKDPKRQNIHVARQALRYQLWQAAGGDQTSIAWNHKLIRYQETKHNIILSLQVGNDSHNVVHHTADVLVGADGIRSQVRQLLLGDDTTPLRYLGCLVVLGIVPVPHEWRERYALLDGETVFQTADGTTRIYMMPYSRTETMWQLSFPMTEAQATSVSQQGSDAMLQEALERCGSWHDPIPQLLQSTPPSLVTGYPVYDRALLEASQLTTTTRRVTLIGDACHPMSPFKGQGANQALLDALALARALYPTDSTTADALHTFAHAMLERSAVKVQASADAAHFLHTSIAIQEGNMTRGEAARRIMDATTIATTDAVGETK
jgi:salicylate hydroxylase